MPFQTGWDNNLPDWFRDLQRQERDLDRLMEEQRKLQWISDETIRIRAKLSAASAWAGEKK